MNSKLKKFAEKQEEKRDREKVGNVLSSAEKMAIALTTWHDHVIARDEIANFITIVGDKMYPFFPQENHVLLPFEEHNGDHTMNWILVWDIVEKKEVFRKNTRNVDLIDWQLKKPEDKKEQ